MKSTFTLIIYLFIGQGLFAQNLSLSELLNLTSTSTSRFLNTLEKKGFRPVTSEKNSIKVFYPKDSTGERYLIKQTQTNLGWLRLEKLTPEEYTHLKQNALSEGFTEGRTSGKTLTEFFEKNEITITASAKIDLDEGKRWYNVLIEKRNLPRLKDLTYAEDLLFFNSHQQLVHVFGKQNTIKDIYHNEDGTAVNCSIIFPNSSREAVFLWKEPKNLRVLASVHIGSNVPTSSAMRYNEQVAQNAWLSRQGVYATMPLGQLQALNQNNLVFYGWGGGANGSLYHENKGKLDLKQMNLLLNCLNCNDDTYYGKKQYHSDKAIYDNKRIYVATIILTPPDVFDAQ